MFPMCGARVHMTHLQYVTNKTRMLLFPFVSQDVCNWSRMRACKLYVCLPTHVHIIGNKFNRCMYMRSTFLSFPPLQNFGFLLVWKIQPNKSRNSISKMIQSIHYFDALSGNWTIHCLESFDINIANMNTL